MRNWLVALCVVGCGMLPLSAQEAEPEISVTIVGYLRDSGCVHRFHEVLKPLPNGCLQACVRAGSPLVILTKDGEVFQPISADMPDKDIRARLLPFAGKLVKVRGPVYERGASKAIAIVQVEAVKE